MKVGQKTETTKDYSRTFDGKSFKGIVIEISKNDNTVVCVETDCCGDKTWINEHWLKGKPCQMCGKN